ncbi:ABC transporter substrate-binding protein [Komagataeibacter europaeus]|uniref:ABC transporter substrate-binding protein n=1 Tax=Komagataeibacter europaeus TaxID=33995 RepID=UPI0015FA72C0|nr:ABC transporter substrate-binding protein [Komagataeibacter europaeus]
MVNNSLPLSRRMCLMTMMATGMTAFSDPSWSDDRTVLSVGDQNESLRSLLEAAGEATTFPYHIEWKQFSQAQPLLQAQNAGVIDFCHAGDVAFLFAYAAGAPIVAIGGSVDGGRSAAIVVRNKSAIHAVQDLRGKRVALSRAGLGEPLLYGALAQSGVDRTDVQVVNVPQSVARMALATGQVDAWVTWQPYVALATGMDDARILRDAKGILSFYVFALAHQAVLENPLKRAAIIDLEKRVGRALEWARTHKDAYCETYARISHLPHNIAALAIEESDRRSIVIDENVIKGTKELYDNLRSYGLLKNGIDISHAFDLAVLD